MAIVKLNVNKPASIHHAGSIAFFQPTADPVLDEEGNEVPAGQEALEVQRGQMQAAEEYENSEEKLSREEHRELLQAASQLAEHDKTSVKEALEKLEQQKDEDAELVAEEKGTSKAEEKAHAKAPVKDEAKPRSVNAAAPKASADKK